MSVSLSLRWTRLGRALLAGAALLAGCGGGGDGGVGVGGTGQTAVPVSVNGPITGFGSVIVGGIKFDDATANILRDALAISNSNLSLGMTIEVSGVRFDDASTGATGSTGKATSIRVFSEMKGPVQAVQAGAGTFNVFGATVRVDASTVIEGIASLAALKAGDTVEVYGLRNAASGEIVATRIEVSVSSNPTAPVAVTLSGNLSALDTVARRFTLNGQNVLYGSATVTGTLQAGASVQVAGTVPAAGGDVTAASVSVASGSALVEGAEMDFSGIVSNFVSRSSLRINGIAVDASSTSLSATAVSRLKDGVRCEVEGKVTGGVLRAKDLSCEDSGTTTTTYEITGTITAFTSAARFTARNQVIDASTATLSGGRLSDLGLGKKVHVKGPVVGGVLKAATLAFED